MSENRTCLVTGSSRGLGRAMALELAARGHDVAVHYVRAAEAAESLAREIGGLGVKAEVFAADVADVEACKNLIKAVTESLGGLDVLVNNAGITRDGVAMRMKDNDWTSVIDTNLSAAFYLSRAALRGMLQRRWGRIISISSVVGLMGNIGQANYVSAKAGLVGLTRALALEYGARGVTVNAVAPGFIESDMTAGLPEELKARYLSSIAAGRFGRAEEVAKVVAFLASDEASYINGQTLAVDGGMAMA
jgi:3-oxoacyl-[acyl-carrier protein] reductase